MQGMQVVFSGVRDSGLEGLVTSLGGQIKSVVSRQTTLLAVTDLSSQTTQVKKAVQYGVKLQSYYDLRTEVWLLRNKLNAQRNMLATDHMHYMTASCFPPDSYSQRLTCNI